MSLGRVTVAGLLLGMAACTSVQSVQPAKFIPEHSPGVVWVTYTGNAMVPVVRPEIAGDTLRGMRQGTQESVAIPLAEIHSVQAKTADGKRTALLITALGVGTASAIYFTFGSKAGTSGMSIDCTRSDVVNHLDQHPECSN